MPAKTEQIEITSELDLSGDTDSDNAFQYKASMNEVEKGLRLLPQEVSSSYEFRLSGICEFLGCTAQSAQKQEGRKVVTYACGIFTFYLLYGILQEEITKGDYGGERFIFAQALVFVQCVLNAIFSKGIMSYTKPEPDRTPKLLYALCAFCYMGAMVASNQALLYISYPTQVIGKACKPIPVMILGVLFAHKRYPLAKYLFIVMIVTGVAGFIYKDKHAGNAVDVSEHLFSIGFGEILLLVSLSLDGFTGVTQERMRAYHQTNHHHMMYNINLWSCLLLGIGLVASGQGILFMKFVILHPEVLTYLAMFSICSAFGQHYIFLTVVTFGPLTCSVITTTRKFFTVLCSVILFQNPLSTRQWLSTILVFAGLGLDSIYGRSLKTQQKKDSS